MITKRLRNILIAGAIVFTAGLTTISADEWHCSQPSCGSFADWCGNFRFNASWLYWKMNGDEFDYAVEKQRLEVLSGDSVVIQATDQESIHDLKFGWDSGFRIGIGFDIPCKGWGVDLNWTHFDTKSSNHVLVNGTIGNTTTYVNLPTVVGFGAILASGESALFKGHETFNYNVLDLELGKWCCCGDSCVMFRPHVGFRFADINEKFHNQVIFTGTDETQGGTDADEAIFHIKNRFKGAGVRAGLDTDLCLCDGFSLIGRGAASLIWGTTHLKNQFDYSTVTINDEYDDEIKEHYRNVRVITDLSFGIRYQTCMCGCYPMYAELVWEHHYLFGQHRYWVDNSYAPNLYGTSSWKADGSVALQGLTLTVGVDF